MNNSEKKEMRDIFSRFFRLSRMIKPHLKLLSGAVLFGVFGHLCSIGLLGFSAGAAAVILTDGIFPAALVFSAVICGLLRGVLRYGEHYFGHDIAFRLLFDIRKQIFAAINRLAPAKLLDRRSGDLCSTVMADVEYIETFFAHTLAPIIIGTVVPMTILAVLASINIGYFFVMLPFYLLMGVLIPVISFNAAAKDGFKYRRGLSVINSRLVEILQGMRELMLFNRDIEMLEELLEESEKNGKSYKRIRANEGLIAALVEIIIAAAVIGLVLMSASLHADEAAGIGEIVRAIVISMSSFGPLISLMFLSNSLVNTSAAAERIFSLIDEEEIVKNPTVEQECINGFQIDIPPRAEHVDFTYSGSDVQILSEFNLGVPKGKISALKAESGRGKGTVLYLMMRFFDPESGKMRLNGSGLEQFELNSLRSGISYFTQETTLFNIPVMENIRIADASATDEEVFAAARKAGVHDFITELPDGYSTMAEEMGGRFSSGERQRIGLARIFLQNNCVILLDEPVSNLDSENEKLIMENLRSGLDGKTVVLVSHRPSVLNLADMIVNI